MPRAPTHRPSRARVGGGIARAPRAGGARPPSNAEVARALQEMSLFLEMHDVPSKPRAFEKAAQAVAALEQPLVQLLAQGGPRALSSIPGVGQGIARRIAELLQTGRCAELEALRRETPVDVIQLTAVEGLGPKHVKALYDALGIRDLEQLEQAAENHQIRKLPHFGDKSEQKILRGVSFQRESHGRVPLGDIWDTAMQLGARLARLTGVLRADIAGSLRRRKETIGDVDFLVASLNPETVMEQFVGLPEVEHVYARGPTKTLLRLRSGIDADLRVVPERSWGAALCYFTGSKAHNVGLRRLAQGRKLKLNEYGLFDGEHFVAGRTEQEIYEALDLPWIAPELREGRGELEAAQAGELPELIGYGSLRGDLQIQTSWTDGANSMLEMAKAAQARGHEYIAITDHTRDLAMARGNDETRLLKQRDAIRALDARLPGIRVLAGAEVNIRHDGTLDISDPVLAQLDVVGAGIHAHFRMPRHEMTQRLIRVLENPHVHILFHPTARSLGRRPPCEVDFDALLAVARRTGTALEIDGHPHRLDLKDEHVRRAIAAGVKLVISSDAHSTSELRFADQFGVAMARRGWATRDAVLNTLPVDAMLAALKSRP